MLSVVTPSVISAFGRWKEEDQEFKTEFTIGLVYIVSSGPEGVVWDLSQGEGGKNRLWEPFGLFNLQHFLLEPHGGTFSPFNEQLNFFVVMDEIVSIEFSRNTQLYPDKYLWQYIFT